MYLLNELKRQYLLLGYPLEVASAVARKEYVMKRTFYKKCKGSKELIGTKKDGKIVFHA